ncbi:MAG: diaminopimelate epimerase [Endozoicomonadaceae bacterium]|nr:diaminopimelate epimerase [Endozoicomonadaceae bacterium]MBE8233721.1 diaminopimelate epimerase [Endozoicomonadaceae bacterium]
MLLRFTKMHGLGNDFMVINGVTQAVNLTPDDIKVWSHRQTGIGFDQLLIVEPPLSPNVDFFYRIFNANGTQAMQCGNGLRCLVQFIHDKKLSIQKKLVIQTENRIMHAIYHDQHDISVNMGLPEFEPKVIPFITDKTNARSQYLFKSNEYEFLFTVLSMDNPHAVVNYDSIQNSGDFWSDPVIELLGQSIQKDPRFPDGCNVGFFEYKSSNKMNVRVYERHVGETMACGSGACAAVVTAILNQLTDTTVTVQLRGGRLDIAWHHMQDEVCMTGPTNTVFEGQIKKTKRILT